MRNDKSLTWHCGMYFASVLIKHETITCSWKCMRERLGRWGTQPEMFVQKMQYQVQKRRPLSPLNRLTRRSGHVSEKMTSARQSLAYAYYVLLNKPAEIPRLNNELINIYFGLCRLPFSNFKFWTGLNYAGDKKTKWSPSYCFHTTVLLSGTDAGHLALCP